MQRLFTTFPNSWPGCGLLLLRLSAGAPLILWLLSLRDGVLPAPSWLECGVLLAGVSLIAGWRTPVAASALALIEAWLAIETGTLDSVHVLRCVLGASLLMIGPGAWSLDARRYGRKRIEVGVR